MGQNFSHFHDLDVERERESAASTLLFFSFPSRCVFAGTLLNQNAPLDTRHNRDLKAREAKKGTHAEELKKKKTKHQQKDISMPQPASTSSSSPPPSSPLSSFLGMRPPAAWVDRLASPLAFYPPFPASYTIKRQPDGRRELYVAPTRESRLPSCAFAEAVQHDLDVLEQALQLRRQVVQGRARQ